MKKNFLLVILSTLTLTTFSQRKTENLVIATLDGMRWEEVFGGVDSAITRDSEQVTKNFGAMMQAKYGLQP